MLSDFPRCLLDIQFKCHCQPVQLSLAFFARPLTHHPSTRHLHAMGRLSSDNIARALSLIPLPDKNPEITIDNKGMPYFNS